MAKSLFDKLWERHVVVAEQADSPALLYIDLHLIHEVTSPQAFSTLKARGLKVRRPDKTFATLDHSTPTKTADAIGRLPYVSEQAEAQVATLQQNCAEHGIDLAGLGDPRRGIVHVIAPELGLTQPGMTIVCGDSHTSTHGAFGALAFGIGTTEVGHVLATQCLLQRKPKSMRVLFEGSLSKNVSAKDMALAMTSIVGADGGQGFAIEFTGQAVSDLSMEGRMTLCNMAIEAGARSGMVAPDAKTIEWLANCPMAPKEAAWEAAVQDWLSLVSDADASFDKQVIIDASAISPMATWGVSPDAASAIADVVPAPNNSSDEKGQAYMGLMGGEAFSQAQVNRVFIGSCTNSRLSDLREAANIFKGRKVHEGLIALIVPGSEKIRAEAEQEGLDKIFIDAGAQWRQPGCSMCIGMNGDIGLPGELVVSTSNRNFIGRQGKGVRTVLASPATAAAAAITGHIVDPREFMEEVA